jgi:hypothetical protein
MGFIEETGAAQHYRDARITAIYEGTTGIQANDLVGRKILRDQGAALGSYLDEVLATAEQLEGDAALASIGAKLKAAADNLQSAARFILEKAPHNEKLVGAVAYNFLMLMGYVAGAWYMGRSAQIASAKLAEGEDAFYENKLMSARFYFTQLLPRHLGYLEAVLDGTEVGVALKVSNF